MTEGFHIQSMHALSDLEPLLILTCADELVFVFSDNNGTRVVQTHQLKKQPTMLKAFRKTADNKFMVMVVYEIDTETTSWDVLSVTINYN